MYQVVNNVSHQAGAHALRAGVDFLFNDDTITFPRAVRGSYTFSSLANFLTGNYNAASRRPSATRSSPDEPEFGVYAQDEWQRRLAADAQPRPALRPAVPRDRSTPTPTTCRRAPASRGRRRSQDFDRARRAPASSSTACRCAPWRMRCCRPVTRPTSAAAPAQRVRHVAGAGRCAGVSRTSCRPVCRRPRSSISRRWTGICRTRTRSRRASRSSEIGARPHDQRRLSVPPRREPADVDQPERADLRRRGHEQRLPADADLREQQPVLVGAASRLSRPARDLPAAPDALGAAIA